MEGPALPKAVQLFAQGDAVLSATSYNAVVINNDMQFLCAGP